MGDQKPGFSKKPGFSLAPEAGKKPGFSKKPGFWTQTLSDKRTSSVSFLRERVYNNPEFRGGKPNVCP